MHTLEKGERAEEGTMEWLEQQLDFASLDIAMRYFDQVEPSTGPNKGVALDRLRGILRAERAFLYIYGADGHADSVSISPDAKSFPEFDAERFRSEEAQRLLQALRNRPGPPVATVGEAEPLRSLLDVVARRIDTGGWIALHVQGKKRQNAVLAFANAAPLVPDEASVYDSLGRAANVLMNTSFPNQTPAREEVDDLFRTLFEQMPVPAIYTTSMDAPFRFNKAFIEFLGYAHDDFAGLDNHEVFRRISDPGDFAHEQKLLVGLLAGKRNDYRMTKRYVHKDGSTRWGDLHTMLVRNANGSMQMGFSIIRDVTESKQSQDQLLNRSIALESTNKELDEFARTVAHDLKSPLSVVLGYARLLESRVGFMTAQEIGDAAAAIARTSLKMDTIIRDLLILAGVMNKTGDCEPLNMRSIVDEAVKRLQLYIRDKNAVLQYPDDWPTACGYAPWIEDVWVNYISNGLKYGGDVPILELGGEVLEDGRVKFWVKDHGPGISRDDARRLFQPFTRLEKIREEGHGLGLSIVRRIVEKLEGEVGVESKIGEGSAFYFILPAEKKAA